MRGLGRVMPPSDKMTRRLHLELLSAYAVSQLTRLQKIARDPE